MDLILMHSMILISLEIKEKEDSIYLTLKFNGKNFLTET